MHEFRVWAPRPERVDVLVDGTPHPMDSVEGGWWSLRLDQAQAGTDYAFCLDGGPARPDPRSAAQPHGVDAPSRVVDHDTFVWSDVGWKGMHLPSAIIYELHVGTFSAAGTFAGAIEHLDHLVDLGVDAIELLPVAEFSGDHGWGYDGVDLYAPHHAYGGVDGLKQLVDACHGRGLGVVMDVVYNHLGPVGNYLSEFGPYFSITHTTNWGNGLNFDGRDSAEVRSFVLDNAVMWLRDYHCDGLRLDAVHAISDNSALHILEELGARVRSLSGHVRRQLVVIAESDRNDPRVVRSVEAGGYGLDGVWADDFHHAAHAVLTGETSGYYRDFGGLAQLADALRTPWVYTGQYSRHRGRAHGRPPIGVPAERFVVCLQNHDQVGNRAVGDRITHLTSLGRAKIGAALTLLSPFVALVFQGEEWAASAPFLYFTDHQDQALGTAVSEGRRREFSSFGWAPSDVPDPQDPATFARSKLDWSELTTGAHGAMFEWYRSLIAVRRRFAECTDAVETSIDESDGWLLATRGPLAVAANVGDHPTTVPAPRQGTLLLASDGAVVVKPGAVELPPESVAVLVV